VSRFALGSVKSVVVQAGDGADVISLQGLGGSSVSSVEVLAGGGDDVISLQGLGRSGIPVTVSGGLGSGTFAYFDPVIISTDPFALPVTNWTITGRDAGTVKNVLFGSVENLVGGKAKDVFTFPSSASEVTGRVNGGGGSNWLNYSDYPNFVSVQLPRFLNFPLFGGATATGGVRNIQNVIGSRTAANRLAGNDDPRGNILVGGDAGDRINGGTVRSILIGGRGADVVT